MSRLFASFALLCLSGTAVEAYPVPRPKEPPSQEELIIGIWEMNADRDALEKPTYFTFTADGRLLKGRNGTSLGECRYHVSGGKLILRRDKEPIFGGTEFPLRLLTGRRLVLSAPTRRNGQLMLSGLPAVLLTPDDATTFERK